MVRNTALALLLLITSGCAHYGQQRPEKLTCAETSELSTECKTSSYIALTQNGTDAPPKIGFAEFDDNGKPYDPSIIHDVIEKISAENTQPDKRLLLVVFIHGWNHNAMQSDSNVIAFKKFLTKLQAEENALAVGTKRSVIGVYMGWQAKASDNDFLSLFSYREKKELGLKTGLTGVLTVLDQLATIRRTHKDNRLVLIGHSFGGGVLFNATHDKLVQAISDKNTMKPKAYGDLVILVNPAVEAEKFVGIHKILEQRTFPSCTSLAMVSFTSEADTALSREFPRGMRLFYNDQFSQASSENKDLITTPYGRYEPFSHYQLNLLSNTPIETNLTKPVFTKAASTWKSFRSGTGPLEIGNMTLHQKTEHPRSWEPVLNVLVDKNIIQEHNEIWDPKFAYFVRGLIGMEFAKGRECR